MKKITVNGGRPLCGEISVSGSKNAALPIIFACILTNGVSEIENLPDIGDVRVALKLLASFGAAIEKKGNVTYIDTRRLSYTHPAPHLVEKMRASTYLLGSCLSRFGRCPIMSFGGCNFSLRPIDMHIDACLTLGARLEGNVLYADKLIGSEISFDKASVGATVNAILLAASSRGETVIRGCAVEPHIDALVDFLISCGASISRKGREMYIVGRELHGGKIKVIGDMIEAGSYLALGLMCRGDIRVLNCPVDQMITVLRCIRELGSGVNIQDGKAVLGERKESKYISITAVPYPGFPTDLQPIFAPLLASLSGGEITDTVWHTRFGYLSALSHFGIEWQTEGNRALIHKSIIHNGSATSPDLRGGMACLMSALCATGYSEIYSAEIILRGYEKLEQKLCAIGAEIKIEDY